MERQRVGGSYGVGECPRDHGVRIAWKKDASFSAWHQSRTTSLKRAPTESGSFLIFFFYFTLTATKKIAWVFVTHVSPQTVYFSRPITVGFLSPVMHLFDGIVPIPPLSPIRCRSNGCGRGTGTGKLPRLTGVEWHSGRSVRPGKMNATCHFPLPGLVDRPWTYHPRFKGVAKGPAGGYTQFIFYFIVNRL